MAISEKRLTERQRQMREELLRLEKHRRDNPVEFLYLPKKWGGITPNPKQHMILEAFKSQFYDTFLYVGGNQSGKTTTWAWLVPCLAAGMWLWNKEPIFFTHKKPRKIRIIGQSWEDHIKKVVIPELKKWWPKNRAVEMAKNNVGAEHFWTDKATGSTIEIMSNLQDSDVFEGWRGDWCIYDEPPKREIYIANSRGLMARMGKQYIGATLLKEPWIDREICRRIDKDGNPDMAVFTVRTETYDNVGYGLTQEAVERFERNLSPEERLARIKGIPAYMSGLVCPDFRREIHIKERHDIPSDWLVDIQIDVHPRKEQAVLFTAVTPQQQKYSCFEIWEHGSGEQIADQIVRIIRRNALRVNRIGIDPLSKGDSNAQAGETTYSKMEKVLARHGYVLEVASKDKNSGIMELNKHLKGPNGEPSWFVFRDMPNTIRQIEGWMYEDKGENQGKPSKKDDDFCECLYRTMLFDTTWYPYDEFEEPEGGQDGTIDEQTGY